MRILARKTKDILSRYRALQVKFRDLEREKDVTIETERKARKKAETELIEMKKKYEKELEEARAIRKRAVLKEKSRIYNELNKIFSFVSIVNIGGGSLGVSLYRS